MLSFLSRQINKKIQFPQQKSNTCDTVEQFVIRWWWWKLEHHAMDSLSIWMSSFKFDLCGHEGNEWSAYMCLVHKHIRQNPSATSQTFLLRNGIQSFWNICLTSCVWLYGLCRPSVGLSKNNDIPLNEINNNNINFFESIYFWMRPITFQSTQNIAHRIVIVLLTFGCSCWHWQWSPNIKFES